MCSFNITFFIIMIMIKSISPTMRRERRGALGLLSPLITAVGRVREMSGGEDEGGAQGEDLAL